MECALYVQIIMIFMIQTHTLRCEVLEFKSRLHDEAEIIVSSIQVSFFFQFLESLCSRLEEFKFNNIVPR